MALLSEAEQDIEEPMLVIIGPPGAVVNPREQGSQGSIGASIHV